MTVLDIDAGNSRVKWRLGELRGAYDRGGPANFPADPAPQRIRVSSVADPSFDRSLSGILIDAYGVEPEFAVTQAHAGGVSCGYDVPAAMGVDRWLAVLGAARRSRPPLVVVDCGTATTIDFVDADGRHTGGYIIPGVGLMRSALFRETADVRGEEELDLDDLNPGGNTQCAVDHGIVLATMAFIEAAVARFGGSCEDAARVYLCGGDALMLTPHLACDVELELDLVLDGLAVALP